MNDTPLRNVLRRELRDGLLAIGVGMPALGVAIFGGFMFAVGWADEEPPLSLALYAVLFVGGIAGRWGSDVLRGKHGQAARVSRLALCLGVGFAGSFWLLVLYVFLLA